MKFSPRSVFVSSLSVMAIFAIHFVLPSMLNNFSRDYNNLSLQKLWDHPFLFEAWQSHATFPPFASRPLTTWMIGGVHNIFDLSYSYSFIVVEFGLLIVCGVLLYRLALLFSSKREANWTLVFFYTSFTILFAFFATIYTYDEPLQYVCFFAALLCIEKKKYPLGMVFFFLALVARETTVFLLPSLLFFIIRRFPPLVGEGKGGVSAGEGLGDHYTSLAKTPSNLPLRGGGAKLFIQNFLLLSIPAIAAFLLIRLYLAHVGLLDAFGSYTGNRFVHFAMNFQNRARGIESLVSPFLALLLPTFLAFYHKKRNGMDEREARYFWAFVLAIIINTPIIFFTALAQETRLFALPLLFMWPFLGKYAQYFFMQFKRVDWRFLPVFAVWILASYFIAFRFYIPAALWDWHMGFQSYLFVSLLVVGWGSIGLYRRS